MWKEPKWKEKRNSEWFWRKVQDDLGQIFQMGRRKWNTPGRMLSVKKNVPKNNKTKTKKLKFKKRKMNLGDYVDSFRSIENIRINLWLAKGNGKK